MDTDVAQRDRLAPEPVGQRSPGELGDRKADQKDGDRQARRGPPDLEDLLEVRKDRQIYIDRHPAVDEQGNSISPGRQVLSNHGSSGP
jgi:hypothetical protein